MRIAAGILTITGGFIGGSLLIAILHELHVHVVLASLPLFVAMIGGIMALKRVHYRWALAGAICSILFPFFGIPAVILLVKRKGEFSSHETAMQGKEKYHWEASTANYEPHERDAHNESEPSYSSSYLHRTPYEPQKKRRRAPRMIGITLACIFAIVILIIAIDPFTPSLSANPLDFGFTVVNGLNPPSQTLEIESSRRAITWSAIGDAQWLNLEPADGITDEETPMTLLVDISGMYPGEYSTTITVSAPEARNTPLKVPVSLVITETKETLAIREAVSGNTNNVEIYYNKQPPYSKGLPNTRINLTNSQSAADPTWQQLLQFLLADDTDDQTYIEGVYTCGSFAETLHNNVEQKGIRAAWVGIDFADDSEGHALNAFYTVDWGLVFVDCTGGGLEVVVPSLEENYNSDIDHDKIAYVQLGEEYGLVSLDVAKSAEYTFYDQYKQQRQEYESRLEDYNRRVEEYNQEISGKVYYRGSSEYYRITRIRDELKQEEAELEQLEQELGSNSWKPLGVVSHVEIYW